LSSSLSASRSETALNAIFISGSGLKRKRRAELPRRAFFLELLVG
jgi:hypothetical protein